MQPSCYRNKDNIDVFLVDKMNAKLKVGDEVGLVGNIKAKITRVFDDGSVRVLFADPSKNGAIVQKSGRLVGVAGKYELAPKRGRPAKGVAMKQVAVRLPVSWVEQFSKRGLTREIQERLFASQLFEEMEPNFRKLTAQIEQLAKRVGRNYEGAQWYEDRDAHAAFLETVSRLLADLPVPTAHKKRDVPPAHVADVIYRSYVAEVRDWESKRSLEMPTTRELMKERGL